MTGGGGGGGGGVRTRTTNTAPWLETFTVDAQGLIHDPKGNIVGSIQNGDTVNADGSFTDRNNVTHYANGDVRDPEGYLHKVDGTVEPPAGATLPVNSQITNVQPISLGAYTVQTDGSILSPAGVVVGSIYNNDKVNADGSFTDTNGVTHYGNGDVRDPEGNLHKTDGSVITPDGTVIPSPFAVQQAQVQVPVQNVFTEFVDEYGLTHKADGSKVAPDGTTYLPDGTIRHPDGTITTADGVVIKQGVVLNIQETPGAWTYNVSNNSYTFTKTNADGSKTLARSEWINTKNNAGNNHWYAIDMNSVMITGWLKDNGEYYYLSENSANKGEVLTGTQVVNGATYQFDAVTGALQGTKPAEKNIHFLAAENHISGIDGEWTTTADGKRQYLVNVRAQDGSITKVPPSAWYIIDGCYYYFNSDGTVHPGLITYNGKYYFINDDGSLLEGGEKKIGNTTYIFDKASGACRLTK